MPNNWTSEQLETFAKAGGFSQADAGIDVEALIWKSPRGDTYDGLPDFPNDIAACLKVAYEAANKHGEHFYYRYDPISGLYGAWWESWDGPRNETFSGPDAVISAVNDYAVLRAVSK